MKFAVTFQSRYQFDVHPVIPAVNNNSFIVIDAPDEMTARVWLRDQLENNYAFIYPLDDDFRSDIEQYNLHEVLLP